MVLPTFIFLQLKPRRETNAGDCRLQKSNEGDLMLSEKARAPRGQEPIDSARPPPVLVRLVAAANAAQAVPQRRDNDGVRR